MGSVKVHVVCVRSSCFIVAVVKKREKILTYRTGFSIFCDFKSRFEMPHTEHTFTQWMCNRKGSGNTLIDDIWS